MKKLLFLTFVVVIVVAPNLCFAYRQQVVGVRGRLFCGNEPLNNTQVKLWNKNSLGTDDQLAVMKTDSTGNFALEGGVGGVFSLNVYLKIYHNCNDGIKPCKRKVQFKIPQEYVIRADKVKNWLEVGTMNMQLIFPDEERSCLTF